jgi:hypothetical protein
MTTLAEKKHMSKVAELGCAVCRRIYPPHEPGPVELHHPRHGAGMGKRSGHMSVVPLCVNHHRGNEGIHGMGTKAFVQHYGVTEAELLAETLELINHTK